MAQLITSQERVDHEFVVFSLFMAGIASREPQEKDLCLGMIRAVERLSYGRMTGSVRDLLERIYEKQRAAMVGSGDASSVDWVEEMKLGGQRIIMYGL